LPAVTRDNIGACTPHDLVGAVSIFNGKYQADG
jgi:hypothetical protein